MAQAKSAIDAGLTVTTMCKGGVQAIEGAEERFEERHGVGSE